MAFRQHAPDLRSEVKGVRQYLKDDVPFRWPESVVPERRKTLSPRLRFENSATVYTVGFTRLPTLVATRSKALNTSP